MLCTELTVVVDAVDQPHPNLGMVVGHEDDVEELLAVGVELAQLRVHRFQRLQHPATGRVSEPRARPCRPPHRAQLVFTETRDLPQLHPEPRGHQRAASAGKKGAALGKKHTATLLLPNTTSFEFLLGDEIALAQSYREVFFKQSGKEYVSPHQVDLLIHREKVRSRSSEGQQKKLHQAQQNWGRNWKTYLKF